MTREALGWIAAAVPIAGACSASAQTESDAAAAAVLVGDQVREQDLLVPTRLVLSAIRPSMTTLSGC